MALSNQLLPLTIALGGTSATTADGAVVNLGFTQNIEVVTEAFSNFQQGTLYFVVSGTAPDFTLVKIHYGQSDEPGGGVILPGTGGGLPEPYA